MKPSNDDDHHHEVAVVMVPLPCQSHLNQLLHLSAVISSHGIPVHFLGSSTHNRQAKLRSHGLIKPINSPTATATVAQIHFHDLPTPPITAPSPDPNAADKTPVHLWPATEAYFNLREPIGVFVQTVSSKTRRTVVVYDRMVSVAVRDSVSIPNVELYAFNCLSAFNLFFILSEANTLGTKAPSIKVDGPLRNLPSVTEFMPDAAIQFIVSAKVEEREGDIHNTCRIVDADFIDQMNEITGEDKKQWAIWPASKFFATTTTTNCADQIRRHNCMTWLDRQPRRSVIYVSFGTTTSLTEEEAAEIALGLEESKQKFLWVLRDADTANIFAGEERRIELPLGFEERVREDGMVVRDWAPQMEILAHESVGGFLSHCGWNSCFESLMMGVPVAAWPIHSDQPLNAIFLTEILKVGLVVREWARRKEVVKAAVIGKVVERLIASEEGGVIRRRAEEMSAALKKSVEGGGECYKEVESFIAHITR